VKAAIPPGVADLLAAGLAHHQAGRLAEAEAYYRQILVAVPDQADILHLLRGVANQAGVIKRRSNRSAVRFRTTGTTLHIIVAAASCYRV
jgi:hypothetical protein